MGCQKISNQQATSFDFYQDHSKSEVKFHLTSGLFLLTWNIILINISTLVCLWCAHQKEPVYGFLLLVYNLGQLFFSSILYRGQVKKDLIYQRSAILSNLPGTILGLLLIVHMPLSLSMNLSWICKLIVSSQIMINGTTLFNTITTLLGA